MHLCTPIPSEMLAFELNADNTQEGLPPICYVLYVLLWIKYWLMWFESLLVFILFKFKKRSNISGIRVVKTAPVFIQTKQFLFTGNHRIWARFTNSLGQCTPSFAVKIVLSGFTKDTQWRISAEKVWTQLFLSLTLLNMHLLEFSF